MERESFVFYKSFMVGVEALSTPEEKLKAYQYILRYGLYGEEPVEKTGAAFGMYAIAKANIDANNKKYVDGCKGGRPKKDWDNSQKPKVSKKITSGCENGKPNDNDNVNVNVNENVNDNEKGSREKQDTQLTFDANASHGNIKEGDVGKKYDSMKLNDKLHILGLEDEVIELATVYNSCKKGKKLDKFKEPQLKIWVTKLRKCGFNTIEGMKQVLENSIAGGYEGIFELKQKPDTKPKPIEEGKVVNVGGANIFF